MGSSLSKFATKSPVVHVDKIGDIELRTSKRAKHLRLVISARNGVYIVRPIGVSDWTVRRFVKKNESWLLRKLDRIRQKPSINDGERFSRTKILRVRRAVNFLKITVTEESKELVLTLPQDVKIDDENVQEKLMSAVIKIWREEAKIYLPERLLLLSKRFNLEFHDVRVKYMHTRWGSCSSVNNINLNIQLMRLEPNLIDHVLLHELVHTREHNHSKVFWTLFESLEPGAKTTSKKLKNYLLF